MGQHLARHLRAEGDDVTVLDHRGASSLDITDGPAVDRAAGRDRARGRLPPRRLGRRRRLVERPGRRASASTPRAPSTSCVRAAPPAWPECSPSPAPTCTAWSPRRSCPSPRASPLRPTSPYAASKLAADALAQQAFLGYGLGVVRVRPFNHLGPGQSEQFVAPAIAARIARAERDGTGTIPVGNLSARRDVTDVRDVVRAYRLLIEHGSPGEVYNVCTGEDLAVQALADLLVGLARSPIELVTDPGAAATRGPARAARRRVQAAGGDGLGAPHPHRADGRRPARRHARASPCRDVDTIGDTMSDRALITGITGQDGSYLAELLLDKGYEVIGMVRRSSTTNFERIAHLQDRVVLDPYTSSGDLLDEASLISILRECRPTEVYNLAAQSFVQTSFTQPVLTGEITALGVTRLLDAIRIVDPVDPLLPGQLERDVRQGPAGAPGGDDPVPPPLALRRREGLRALDHRQLPRVLRPPRVERHPVQPRVATTRAGVPAPQGEPRRGPDQARAGRPSCRSGTSTPSATGASPVTTSRRCG